jgi:hypothetical protein
MLSSLSGALLVVSVMFGMIPSPPTPDIVAQGAYVVINEIHSDPDLKTEPVEYVELYNAGDQEADISGWQFSMGISYTFDQSTVLAAGDYLIVAQSPEHVLAKGRAWRFALNADRVLGPFGGKLSNETDRLVLRDAQAALVDEVEYQLGFPWPTVGDAVPPTAAGTGHSLQLINPLSDNDLGGSWRSAAPTPTGANRAVYTLNVPPLIRQVRHEPQQPRSAEVVTVTAKVTDPDGVDAVILLYQVVEPGQYIRLGDAEYERLWTDVEMNDSGVNGDGEAGDGIYTVQLSKLLQAHRRLIRYRITAVDTGGALVTVPYADDPQPNFAYFVYDGVPAWSGAVNPGNRQGASGQARTYDVDVMRSLPVYHLLSKATDVENCQFRPIPDARCNPQAGLYQWTGALVYDGVVYDHIRYRARGGWATYEFGKNRWKFDFNRGHSFRAHDNDGRAYPVSWDKLNFSACFQFDGTNNRGEHGMYEAVSAKLMALAGVPVSNMHWLQFRVIDNAFEASPTNQYQGDLWGLYLAIEQPDGRFLKARDLPDGNLYKMYFACSANPTNMNNQGPTQVTDHSDVQAFWNAYRAHPSSRQWWGDTVNLPLYYNYRLICDAVHHYDLSDGWNILYYHHPDTERWWAFPWDFDHSWDTDIYTHDDEYWKQVLAPRFFQGHRVTHPNIYHEFPDCIIAFQNRARELQDLLINQDQCVQLINDCAATIADPQGGPSFVDVDRAMWDHHPRTRSKGSFYNSSPTGDFAGMVERMRTFISPKGWGYENIARIGRDSLVPDAPHISYVGPPGYPGNALSFESTPFVNPQGDKRFRAQQWRVAEIDQGTPGLYEIEALWESPESKSFEKRVTIPGSVVRPGQCYRVRHRVQDVSGRWSHWSTPLQFVAGPALSQAITQDLRITELMVNPADPPLDDTRDNDEFEFIELKNIGDQRLDLSHVSLKDGVRFDFSDSRITHLDPGQFVLVVRSEQAFTTRYGSDLTTLIAGEYTGKLSNGGEKLRLEDFWTGLIAEFSYDDGPAWPQAADGEGHSLVPLSSSLFQPGPSVLDDPAKWRASTDRHGSPGRDEKR